MSFSNKNACLVYLENFVGVDSYIPILYFDGNNVNDLVDAILDFLQASGECLPVIEVYSARKGVAGREKLDKNIPATLESVYITLN